MRRGILIWIGLHCWAGSSAQAATGTLVEAFDQLRLRASAQAYDLRIAQSGLSQARAQQFTSWTRWLPRLDLQLSQSRAKDYSFKTSGTLGTLSNFAFTPEPISLSRWELDLSMPIFRRSVVLGVEQATADKTLAEDRYRLRRTELDWRMRSLFGDYLLQRYKEAALNNSLELARTNLREAQLRFELGQRTKVDVLRAKANVASLEARRISYSQQRSGSLNQFLEYTGLREADLRDSGVEPHLRTEEEIACGIEAFVAPEKALAAVEPLIQPELPVETLEKQVVDSSPSYHAIRAEEESSLVRAQSLMAQEWPELALRGNINKQAQDWETALSGTERSYSAAVTLVVPIFSWGSFFSSRIEKSQAQDGASLKAEKDVLRLRNEIENDRIQLRSLISLREAQALSLEQNEELVKLSFKSYQLGKTTILELLGSQNDLLDAKINLAKTKIDLAVLARKLAWNLGVNIGE